MCVCAYMHIWKNMHLRYQSPQTSNIIPVTPHTQSWSVMVPQTSRPSPPIRSEITAQASILKHKGQWTYCLFVPVSFSSWGCWKLVGFWKDDEFVFLFPPPPPPPPHLPPAPSSLTVNIMFWSFKCVNVWQSMFLTPLLIRLWRADNFWKDSFEISKSGWSPHCTDQASSSQSPRALRMSSTLVLATKLCASYLTSVQKTNRIHSW